MIFVMESYCSLAVILIIFQSFQVHAKDADSGMNGKVIYEIIESSDDPFQIDPFSKFYYAFYLRKIYYNLIYKALNNIGPPIRKLYLVACN